MLVRSETPMDYPQIRRLTLEAFAATPFSNGREHLIIDALRVAGDLTLSLVTQGAGGIVGHAAFSPATVGQTEGRWYALGPISVAPNRRKRGIARRMIDAGLDWLAHDGASGCVLIGNPQIYSRLGFRSGGISYRSLDRSFILWRAFGKQDPRGELRFSAAFEDS